jgi:2-polyprenyl-3-methyl-5-hydroxy-6-metoxy-1,4-benzoquinol methylase
MTSGVARATERRSSTRANGKLLVALPEPGLSMTQDTEWCVVRVNGAWRQIRFHDYDELYSVPGLYEKIIYDILRCNSPHVVRSLLEAELSDAATPADELRVLDLGAGNGIVGEELADLGARFIVGVDIIEEAAKATRRDRSGLYDHYHVVDITDLDERQRRELTTYRFNTLTCVAALGFGDIPPRAFVAAYNLIRPGGWIAFNIKEDFLSNGDRSGFARLIQAMAENGTLELRQRRRYPHRLATDRHPLHYVAIVGIKRRDVPEHMLRV